MADEELNVSIEDDDSGGVAELSLEDSDEADELQSRVDELEDEKDDLNDEIEKLKKENGDLNDKVEELEGE